MANHLTPEELSKELGIDRQEVIRRCIEEVDPDLPGEDRQDPVPGAARGGSRRTLPLTPGPASGPGRALRRSSRSTGGCERAARRRGGFRRRRRCLRWPRRSAAAPPSGRPRAPPAAGSGATISSPASFASSIALSSPRYSFSKSSGRSRRRGSRRAGAPSRAPASCTSVSATASSISSRDADVLRVEERLERERVALAGGSGRGSPCPRARTCRRRHARLLHRSQQQDVRPPARRRRSPARGSTRGRSRSGRPRRADEPDDLDRLRARQRDGLEVGLLDEHVLALRELPALDELVGLDVALVNGHQRFCLIGVPHSRCSVRNETSLRCCATASPIGMLTRPKLMEPFQMVRMTARMSSRGYRRFRPLPHAGPVPFRRTVNT